MLPFIIHRAEGLKQMGIASNIFWYKLSQIYCSHQRKENYLYSIVRLLVVGGADSAGLVAGYSPESILLVGHRRS